MFTIRIAKQEIKRLIDDLRINGYSPSRAILFGSVAKGKANHFSDIDVALWDEKFTGCRPIDYESLVKILHNYPRMELHTFHIKETSADNPFIKEIEKDGIVISIEQDAEQISAV